MDGRRTALLEPDGHLCRQVVAGRDLKKRCCPLLLPVQGQKSRSIPAVSGPQEGALRSEGGILLLSLTDGARAPVAPQAFLDQGDEAAHELRPGRGIVDEAQCGVGDAGAQRSADHALASDSGDALGHERDTSSHRDQAQHCVELFAFLHGLRVKTRSSTYVDEGIVIPGRMLPWEEHEALVAQCLQGN